MNNMPFFIYWIVNQNSWILITLSHVNMYYNHHDFLITFEKNKKAQQKNRPGMNIYIWNIDTDHTDLQSVTVKNHTNYRPENKNE